MMPLAQVSARSAQALRFGRNGGEGDDLSEAEQYKAKYYGLDPALDPKEVRRELAERLSDAPGAPSRRDYFQKSTAIPPVDEARTQFTEIKEPATADIMMDAFWDLLKTDSDFYTVDWGSPEPTPKVPNGFRKAIGGFEPIYPFALDKVNATVTLKSDKPGPLRAWRYEKDGRRHRLSLLWENPGDKQTQYLLFEDKVGNFYTHFRRDKTDRALHVFMMANQFLADQQDNPGPDKPDNVGWGTRTEEPSASAQPPVPPQEKRLTSEESARKAGANTAEDELTALMRELRATKGRGYDNDNDWPPQRGGGSRLKP